MLVHVYVNVDIEDVSVRLQSLIFHKIQYKLDPFIRSKTKLSLKRLTSQKGVG